MEADLHKRVAEDTEQAFDAAVTYVKKTFPGIEHSNGSVFIQAVSTYISNYMDHYDNLYSLEHYDKTEENRKPWE